MDAILCKLDIKNMKLQYAAANNSFYIIRNKELIVCKADKMPVGKAHHDAGLFNNKEVDLQKGDVIYTFTDGYADQFGGPKGKKFLYKQKEGMMLSIVDLPMSEQKKEIEKRFDQWKGHMEQIDDVLVIGVRIL